MVEFDLVAADELIARRIAGKRMDCAQGCAWCCHQLIVMTNRDDAIAMLRAARAQLSTAEFHDFEIALREQATQISKMTHEEAETKHWTCPFLRDNSCSIYDLRPVACRSVTSPDASCCKAMMEAECFAELSNGQQVVATEIGTRAMALQIEINDRRPITGAVEMRGLLVELLDGSDDGRDSGLPRVVESE